MCLLQVLWMTTVCLELLQHSHKCGTQQQKFSKCVWALYGIIALCLPPTICYSQNTHMTSWQSQIILLIQQVSMWRSISKRMCITQFSAEQCKVLGQQNMSPCLCTLWNQDKIPCWCWWLHHDSDLRLVLSNQRDNLFVSGQQNLTRKYFALLPSCRSCFTGFKQLYKSFCQKKRNKNREDCSPQRQEGRSSLELLSRALWQKRVQWSPFPFLPYWCLCKINSHSSSFPRTAVIEWIQGTRDFSENEIICFGRTNQNFTSSNNNFSSSWTIPHQHFADFSPSSSTFCGQPRYFCYSVKSRSDDARSTLWFRPRTHCGKEFNWISCLCKPELLSFKKQIGHFNTWRSWSHSYPSARFLQIVFSYFSLRKPSCRCGAIGEKRKTRITWLEASKIQNKFNIERSCRKHKRWWFHFVQKWVNTSFLAGRADDL